MEIESMRELRTVLLAAPALLLLGACQPDQQTGRDEPGAAPQTAPGIVPAAVPPAPGTVETGVAPSPLPMDTVGRVRTQGLGTDTPAQPPRP
jgi:hypothetical protein